MHHHSIVDRDRLGRFESFRAWLHLDGKDRFGFSFEVSPNRKYRSCGVSVGRGSRSIQASVRIPYVIALYFKIKGVLPYGKKREIELSFHGGAMWWSFWTDPWGDEVRWSKLRRGSFHFDTFLFGRSNCERVVIEERDVLVPMPEKAYQAHAKLVRYEWSRPRWFTKRMMRVEIDVPEGIPHEGKGENSWDCGRDATYGMTTGECHSIPEGVGMLVGSCLRDRVKYGGWGDWSWPQHKSKSVVA